MDTKVFKPYYSLFVTQVKTCRAASSLELIKNKTTDNSTEWVTGSSSHFFYLSSKKSTASTRCLKRIPSKFFFYALRTSRTWPNFSRHNYTYFAAASMLKLLTLTPVHGLSCIYPNWFGKLHALTINITRWGNISALPLTPCEVCCHISELR